MESEDSKLVNGGANGEKAEDPVSESYFVSGEEEFETPKGSQGTDDTIRNLHHEMQSLRRDRSDLRRRIDDIRSEMDRSESESKALALHASYLEGELVRTQEDLTAALASASAAETELSLLKSSVKSLEESAAVKESKIADLELELERTNKDGEIQALTDELRVSKEASERTVKELKAAVAREEVLEKSAKEMQQRNSELEIKINALLAENKTVGLDLEKTSERSSELEGRIGKHKRSRELELETTLTASGSSVSWATTAGVAATTGAIAVALTMLYLRRQQ